MTLDFSRMLHPNFQLSGKVDIFRHQSQKTYLPNSSVESKSTEATEVCPLLK